MEKSGTDTGDRAGNRTASQAKWTFLVYMAGDNNLDGAALRDIAEMARAGSTKEVNILVQLDRIEDNLTRRFRITRGGGFKKDCIQTFGDTNTGDPQILYEFVKWAVDNYPADRYALILWNHGSGWWEDGRSRAAGPAAMKPRRRLFRQPVRYPVPQEHLKISAPKEHRSICYDDTSGGDALDNRELRVRQITVIVEELACREHARRIREFQGRIAALEAYVTPSKWAVRFIGAFFQKTGWIFGALIIGSIGYGLRPGRYIGKSSDEENREEPCRY